MRKKIFVFFFFGFLVFEMIITFVSPKKSFNYQEAKKLTKSIDYDYPEQYLSGELFDNIESYFSDQLFLKESFQEVHTDFLRTIGYKTINNYTVTDSKNICASSTGTADVKKYADILESVKNKSQKQGIPFLYVATPFKTDILLENGKDNGHVLSNKSQNADTLFSYLKEKKVDYLNLEEPLQVLQDSGETPFFHTDHHWTCYGAYGGYKEIIERLKESPVDDTKVWKFNEFKRVKYKSNFYGSCIRGLGGTLLYDNYDSLEVLYSQLHNFTFEYKKNLTSKMKQLTGDGSIFLADKKENEKYYDYYTNDLCGGNTYYTHITNNSLDDDAGVLVMAGDSFSLMLLPMLSVNFKEIYYADARKMDYDIIDFAKEKGADQIIMLYNNNLSGDRYTKWEKYFVQ